MLLPDSDFTIFNTASKVTGPICIKPAWWERARKISHWRFMCAMAWIGTQHICQHSICSLTHSHGQTKLQGKQRNAVQEYWKKSETDLRNRQPFSEIGRERLKVLRNNGQERYESYDNNCPFYELLRFTTDSSNEAKCWTILR